MTTSVSFDVYAKDRASKTFTEVGNSASKSEGHLSGLKKTLVAVGSGFAALEVAKKAGEFLKSSTEAAIDDQAAQRKLALALKNTTGANKEQTEGVEEWLKAQSTAYGLSVDDLMPAFQRLAESSGSVTKAQREMKIAMDVSAGTGKDLSVVTAALMKANNGTTTSLSRLGLKTKEQTANTAAIKSAQISAQSAQIAYNKALKDYGKNSDQAKIAGEKLSLAQGKVTTAQKTTATSTLTLNQALTKMSQTFHGQAEARAQSFQGSMDRLHSTLHLFEVEVGDRMLPVLTRLANWFINRGLPALEEFGREVQTKLEPTMRLLRQEFNKDSPTVDQFTKAIKQAGPPIGRLADNILSLGHKSDSKGTPALLRLGLAIQNHFVYKPLAEAIQGLGGVATAILKVGSAGQASYRQVVKWGQSFDNAELKVEAFANTVPGKIQSAVGNLGHVLFNAGQEVIGGLVSGIESKIGDLTGALHKVTSLIPLHKGPIDKDRVLLQPAGQAIMDGLIKGIQSRKVPLQTVLDAVTGQVQAANAKLKSALSNRNSFASGFQSFTTSAFGADYGTDDAGNSISPTVASILAYQKQQRDQAKTVKTDVRKLVKMGLSPALIKQLQAQGAAGIPEIEALAGASRGQIRQYNALNKQTSSDLHSAGMTAANRLYGQQIKQDRKSDNEVKHLLEEIRNELKREHEAGHEVSELRIEGHTLVAFLKKVKRTTGASP